MTVSIIAIILLVMRFVAASFTCMVLYRQIRLFRLSIETELIRFRVLMFILGIVLLLGNVLPIIIDYNYAFIVHEHKITLLVWYAISNAITTLISSIVLWHIYKMAGMALDIEQKSQDKEQKVV